ncbi:MAG: RNA methyltransferase [Armatimonadaceae bacterium]
MKQCKNVSPARRPISNSRHPAIASINRLLESREEREQAGLFYTEGWRFVFRALENRFTHVESLVVTPETPNYALWQRLLHLAREQEIPIVSVTPTVFQYLSRAEEPQGIGVVVRQPWERLHRIRPDTGLCWLALDTIRSPGNLGTMLRTLEAVGGAGVIVIGDAIDPFIPEVFRATMGALFDLRFVRATWGEFQRWRERHSVSLIGTSPHATTDYADFAYPDSLVLWMGSERKGLSDKQQGECDEVVRIPMVGASDSLNVAIASGVLLYEIFNQRRLKTTASKK